MANEDIRRIVIGLLGPQLLELRVSDDAYQALRKAIENGDSQGWHVIPTQDSEVLVDLSKVVYLSLASQEHRVGF
jgi:hypothetical protein